jgi:hypothetical protein
MNEKSGIGRRGPRIDRVNGLVRRRAKPLMVNGRTRGAMRQVARIFEDGTLAGLSDREILARFVEVRDEAAFEALLARHGAMVWNVPLPR